jgi:hypothetical protein
MTMTIIPALPSANAVTFQAATGTEREKEVSKKGNYYRNKGRKASGTSGVVFLSFSPLIKDRVKSSTLPLAHAESEKKNSTT